MNTDQVVAARVRQARTVAYAEGVRDGMEIALALLLGEEVEGGVPYEGRLNKSAQEWAEAALARIREEGP